MPSPSQLPDFSEYLTSSRVAQEEFAWASTRLFERNAANIISAAKLFSLGDSFRLLELGCGSGWVPTVLPLSIHYQGVDSNPSLIHLARKKNSPSREFILSDIREFDLIHSPIDLVCSFAVLKHFSLAEFPEIFRRMLFFAPCGVFNIQTAPVAYDDGIEYHHTWVTDEMIQDIVREAKREVTLSETLHVSDLGEDRIFYIGGNP